MKKFWQVLNINTGTLYQQEYDTFEDAESAAQRQVRHNPRHVCRIYEFVACVKTVNTPPPIETFRIS